MDQNFQGSISPVGGAFLSRNYNSHDSSRTTQVGRAWRGRGAKGASTAQAHSLVGDKGWLLLLEERKRQVREGLSWAAGGGGARLCTPTPGCAPLALHPFPLGGSAGGAPLDPVQPPLQRCFVHPLLLSSAHAWCMQGSGQRGVSWWVPLPFRTLLAALGCTLHRSPLVFEAPTARGGDVPHDPRLVGDG